MDLDPSVVWDFAGTLVGTLRERPRQLPATVSRVDPDGTVWLSMPGADGLVPASTTADVRADDAVTVEWWGNAYHVTGNGTSPSIGTRAARAMRRATAAAAKVAGEAKGIADAVGQHFWADDNGVHVSNEDGNAVGERNILMNSLGILLRQGSAWLASFSDSAVAFYDGLGNAAENIVSQFGAYGATIGRAGESRMELDYHSLRMVDRGGGTYFWASDLRDKEGYLTETFDGDGVTRRFMVALDVKDSDTPNPYASVLVDGIDTRYTMNSPREFVLANTPVSGAEIVVRYMPRTDAAKAYTLGKRADGKVGPYSVAEGDNTIASGNLTHAEGSGATAKGHISHAEGYFTYAGGPYSHAEGYITTAGGFFSHAQNYRTTAASEAQTAIGKYNDNDPSHAFEVGNGTADDARSNAFAVGWDGTLSMNGVPMADYIIEQGTSGIWTYRKWSSGIAECWGTRTASIAVNTASAAYGGYRSAQQTVALPSGLFSATPCATGSFATSQGVWLTSMWATSKDSVRFFLSCGSSMAAADRPVNISVHGRWK